MNTTISPRSPFQCPRSCAWAEHKDWCRFNPLFVHLGIPEVNSHTAAVKVDYRNTEALEAAVLKLNGTWLGEGDHQLYEDGKSEAGFGFRLPNWQFPLVVRKDRSLAYDDYHGQWGDVKDLPRLNAAYTVEGIRLQATELGWTAQEEGENLVVYHPQGGMMTVATDGTFETSGFTGNGCHEFAEQLVAGIGERVEVMETAAAAETTQAITVEEEVQ